MLFQYMEFLAAALKPDELASIVPDVDELMGVYGLEAAVAFDIARPKLRQALRVSLPSPASPSCPAVVIMTDEDFCRFTMKRKRN